MIKVLISALQTLSQFLAAGIAITAFSLLLYALTFNLRDRVARSFALIMACVTVVFVGDAIGSTAASLSALIFWLKLEWVGILFIPAAFLHFSDAILATTGRPSRGRRSLVVRLAYLVSFGFLLILPTSWLVGPLMQDVASAFSLQRTWLTMVFTLYYLFAMGLVGYNLVRAYRRTVSRVSRRRMGYLLVGALAPALGSYPYLLFGSSFAVQHPLLFWMAVFLSNLVVSVLLVVMAYAVAFFGVPWADRVIKRRLFKWLMRGPVTASIVLMVTTLTRRAGEYYGFAYTAAVPVVMAGLILVLQYMITLAAPFWERWLFLGSDRKDLELVQKLEERLLTAGDLRQFLESILAAVCDRLQASSAFITTFSPFLEIEMWVTVGDTRVLEKEDLSSKLVEQVTHNGNRSIFSWGDFWLVTLSPQRESSDLLLGLLGVYKPDYPEMDEEHREALITLAERSAMALEDRLMQRQIFDSLETLTPAVEMIQRLRAAARYNSGVSLVQALPASNLSEDQNRLARWVKDALTHYWGGPKLTRNPLMGLRVVQEALKEYEGNPTNALRSILRQAIEQVRPEGERRFTGEWILYNILELKFMEGKSVREVALRLAMSEADLYRKQRIAIDAVVGAILDMEKSAAGEDFVPSRENSTMYSA